MNAEAKTHRVIVVLECLYFGLVPFLPIRDIEIGPTNLLNWLAVVNLVVLLIVPCRKRVWSSPSWSIASGLLLASWAIGLTRAPAFAQESAFLWSARFAVPWLMLSVSPLDGRHLRLLCASWFAGLCLTAVWQYFAISNSGLEVGEYSSYSYSRMLQQSDDWMQAGQLGVYNTFSCMAVSIAGACALALALSGQRKRGRVVLGIGALLLFISAWTGRFIASDLVSFMGVILAVGLAVASAKEKFSSVLQGLAVLILTVVVGNSIADLEFNSTWDRLINMTQGGIDADYSTATRISMLGISLSSWLSNPIFGVGAMGWPEDLESYIYISGHSSLVDIPAQIGILGLAGFYGLMFLPLRMAIICFRNKDCSPGDREAANLVIIGMPLLFAASAFNHTFMMPTISETLLLLAALGATLSPKLPGLTGGDAS